MRLAASELTERALASVLGLFLLLTLFRGGNTDIAITAALVGTLALLVALVLFALANRNQLQWPSTAAMYFIAALLVMAIAGAAALVATPPDMWLSLPGRAAYRSIVNELVSPEFAMGSLPLSIDPRGTQRALCVLAPCIAIAVVVPFVSRASLLRLLGLFAVLATFEAMIGLIQLGFRGALVFDFAGHSRASGTFVNKNHFATLLAMSLPLLIFRASGQFTFFSHEGKNSSPLSNTWWGIAGAFVAAALIASLSRAGVLAGGVVAMIAMALCAARRRSSSPRFLLLAIAVVLLAISVAAMTGLGSLLRSLLASGLGDGVSSRTLINAHTWNGITAFFPVGAGLGSFSTAFQRFQSPTLLGYIEYAHNDYLQLCFELGIVGVAVLLLLGLAAVHAARTLFRAGSASQHLSPALACLLGALAFAIHAWFDFPAHIPSLAIIVTLLFSAAVNNSLVAVSRLPVVDNDPRARVVISTPRSLVRPSYQG